MAYYRLKAEFFVSKVGVTTPKARPLKDKQKRAIYVRDGGRCQLCHEFVRFGGKEVSPWEQTKSGAIDHIFPRSRGGQNHDENLRVLCMSCNSQKGAH